MINSSKENVNSLSLKNLETPVFIHKSEKTLGNHNNDNNVNLKSPILSQSIVNY